MDRNEAKRAAILKKMGPSAGKVPGSKQGAEVARRDWTGRRANMPKDIIVNNYVNATRANPGGPVGRDKKK